MTRSSPRSGRYYTGFGSLGEIALGDRIMAFGGSTRPTVSELAVKAKKVRLSIVPQADATGITYSARKMKPNGTAGKVTVSGALPAGTTSLALRTPGAMHGAHLSISATGPGGASPGATLVWGRRTPGRIGACKPVRVTKATFAAKTRVSFPKLPKRQNSCARLLVGKRSRVVRKGKTSMLLPAAGRAVFPTGTAKTVVVLG